jgi:ribonuclease HI
MSRSDNRLDRQRLSRLLELVGARLPLQILEAEFPELSREDIQQFFQSVAEHVRECPGLKEIAAASNHAATAEVRRGSLYCDGASRGNPGPAGAGVLLLDDRGMVIVELSRFLDTATNNQAEYQALIRGLKAAADFGLNRVQIFLDSELVVKQVLGKYRVRHPRLQPLFREALSRLQHFDDYDIVHVGREYNQEADRLANEAIDRGLRGGKREHSAQRE